MEHAATASQRVTEHWASRLGVAPSVLATAGVHTAVRPRESDWNGVMFLVRDHCGVVSWPANRANNANQLERELAIASSASLLDPDRARRIVGDGAGLVIGPAYQGYLEPHAFRPCRDRRVRRLGAADAAAIETLRDNCSAADWETSGIDPSGELWGAFEESKLVALAQMRSGPSGLGDPCVLTHARARGQGLGAAVTSAVVARAVEGGTVVVYQTLLSNAAAVKIATSLGFALYAQTVAVRLTSS